MTGDCYVSFQAPPPLKKNRKRALSRFFFMGGAAVHRLRRTMDGKQLHVMYFQSENAVFKFLRGSDSVQGA